MARNGGSFKAQAGYVLLAGILLFPIQRGEASYYPVNTDSAPANVGIGTSLAGGGLVVMNGNLGVGTWISAQVLDAGGTVKANYLSGDGTALTGIGGWNVSGTRVYTNAGTNVGLGTAAPQGKLIVQNGNVGISSNIAGSRLRITGDGAATLFRANPYGPTDAGPVFINLDGNVGIGTTRLSAGSPTYARFQVFNNTSNTSTDKSKVLMQIAKVADGTSTDNPALVIACSGQTCSLSNPVSNTGVLRIDGFANNASVMINTMDTFVVQGNGNVGVGTTLPAGNLTVNGGAGIGTSGIFLATVPPHGGMYIQNNLGLGTVTPQARLNVLGNVGIGTWTADNAALIVRGGNVGIGTDVVTSVLAWKGAEVRVPVTLTDAATIATDASLGNYFRVTLGGNRTLGNPTNGADGQQVTWELSQDGTGSRTITLDTRFGLGADINNINLSTAANKRDLLRAVYNVGVGTWYVIGFTKGY